MKVSQLYGGGSTGRMMAGKYYGDPVHAWFQNRHAEHGKTLINADGKYVYGKHEWKVPYGIRYALEVPLIHVQIVNQYPWAVTWRSPKTKKRLRKHFGSLAHAVHFTATKAQYVDKHASIISRQRCYDLPPGLRNKIPMPWRWCPRCMTARKFKRMYNYRGDPETFYGQRKEYNVDKGIWEWKERKLALLICPFCGCNNRHPVMRRSNQHWEKRTFKPGVTRARRRRRR